MASQALAERTIRRHGGSYNPEEFYRFLNVTFHDFEAEVYDEAHLYMWESLPQQFVLLVDDWLAACSGAPSKMRMLDIGCGTGLASDSLLRTAIGPRIESVDLLDISPAMLRRASERALGWRTPAKCYQGMLEALPAGKTYDLIAACSLLHHVPDVCAFLRSVRARQAGGGVFLHLQDPNGDYFDDPELKRRVAEHTPRHRLPEWAYRFTPSRIAGRLYRELTGTQGQDLISKTNRALLERGMIATPLSTEEVYALIDIHVHDGHGISLKEMASFLPEYKCVSQRAYVFYGRFWSQLPPRLKKLEEALSIRRELGGSEIGAIWKLLA